MSSNRNQGESLSQRIAHFYSKEERIHLHLAVEFINKHEAAKTALMNLLSAYEESLEIINNIQDREAFQNKEILNKGMSIIIQYIGKVAEAENNIDIVKIDSEAKGEPHTQFMEEANNKCTVFLQVTQKYEKKIQELFSPSPSLLPPLWKSVLFYSLYFAGILLGAVIGGILGLITGMAAGGAIGSVIPLLGTLGAAVAAGNAGAIAGCIKGAGLGAIISAAVGACLLGGAASAGFSMFKPDPTPITIFGKIKQEAKTVQEIVGKIESGFTDEKNYKYK